MARFIAHAIDGIKGIEILDVQDKVGSNFLVHFSLVFKDGNRQGPFALRQQDGVRTTLDGREGNPTTLRKVVYGKSRALKWLDDLYYKVQQLM
ncbi:hypothetical protein D3C78_18680 [compost metagenome]